MKNKKKNDIILIAALLAVAAIGFLVFNLTRVEGDFAVVLVEGRETARYSLDEDLDIIIHTEGEHENRLVINNGKAMILEADCPDKICVSHRAVSHAGESIVCLPHKLVISIEAKADEKTPDIAI